MHGGINERLGLACWRTNPLDCRSRNRVEFNRNVLQRFLGTQPELTWVDPEAGPLALLGIRGVTDSGPFIRSAPARRSGGARSILRFSAFELDLQVTPWNCARLCEIGRILPEFLN